MSRQWCLSKKASKPALALVLTLTSLSLPLSASLAVSLPDLSAKKALLQVPGYDKLTDGDGPGTHDGSAATSSGDTKPANLSPMTLHDQDNIDSASTSNNSTDDTAGGGMLKSGVTTTDYVAKPNEQTLENKSVVGKGSPDSKLLVKQASKVGLGPVQLIESNDETDKKVDAILTAEQKQLNELWEATLSKSPDVQFIVQKLQPTSNPSHLSTILTRMLSTAAFGGLGAMTMVSPNMGTYAMASAGGNLIQQALGMKESANAKRAKLSQEEELVMFNMVRNTCDKLVGSYRDYKKNMTSLQRASNDLQDLKGMVADARAGQDNAKQVEMEYTIRKQQRDIDGITDEVRRFRENLVDLAGSEAVVKLDKELDDEQNQVREATAMAEPVKQPNAPAAVIEGQEEVKTETASEPAKKTETTAVNATQEQPATTDAVAEEQETKTKIAANDAQAELKKTETSKTDSNDLDQATVDQSEPKKTADNAGPQS